jgi:hypothetical protein
MKVLTSGPEGEITHAAFIHQDNACPILQRIQAALRLRAAPIGGAQ